MEDQELFTTTAGGSLSSNSVSNYHGAVVAGIVGADDDGQGVEGVADEADMRYCQMPADIRTQAGLEKLKACMTILQLIICMLLIKVWIKYFQCR